MNKHAGRYVLGMVIMLSVTLPLARSQEQQNPSSIIDPLYQEVTSGMYFDVLPPNTGPELTIDVGQDVRLILPPRFAEQRVLEVKRLLYSLGPGLEDAVVVGLHAGTPHGPSQAFALIYALEGGKAVLKAELPLRQYFIRFEILTINQKPVLAIHGASGAHFDDLWLYRFPQGTPELLLAKGSAAGVDLRPDPASGDPQVWVGIENWEDPDWNYASGKRLWNVYGWTGGEAFTFNQTLSTAQEVALDTRTNEYVQRVMSNLDTKR